MKCIQIKLLVQSYDYFAEWVDLAYWWSFSSGGSASAVCAAGIFLETRYFIKIWPPGSQTIWS